MGKSIKAEQYCKENDLKFTPVRRKVLEILLQKNTALGAYEILDFCVKQDLNINRLLPTGHWIFL